MFIISFQQLSRISLIRTLDMIRAGYAANGLCATWKENACFWDNNPFVNGIIELETYAEKKTEELLTEWGGKYTEVYDIRWMVEGEYLKLSTEPTSTLIKRREKAKGVNYYNCYQKLGLNP